MINHITYLMEKIQFPPDAKDFFCDIYKKLSEEDLLKGTSKNWFPIIIFFYFDYFFKNQGKK